MHKVLQRLHRHRTKRGWHHVRLGGVGTIYYDVIARRHRNTVVQTGIFEATRSCLASARRHSAKAGDLAAILNAHDLRAEMLTTDRPGYVVHEDDVQVLAEPFRNEHPLVTR